MSFWIGLLMAKDRHHAAAHLLWAADPGPLLTTNHAGAISFEVMRQQRLTEVLAFVGDFSSAEFVEIRP